MPRWAKTQLKALYDGSNSHNQASVLIAGGMTHGISSMPRHLRWPWAGRVWTKWAAMNPINALKITAGGAQNTARPPPLPTRGRRASEEKSFFFVKQL